MAEVYLAEQVSLRRQVAVKVLKRELAGDETYVRRFHNEAMAAASLTHANIVQIHEVGERDGIHFIAQEYVPGRNLGELIKRNGPLDVKLAVLIMRQVAAALHRAAEQGIVHRDIKPENIMLAPSGEVKVADFGLARVQGNDGVNLTQIGMTMGTPLYMSPEQIEGRPLDGRADLYSFGVTCYHMLTGQPPFAGDTPLAVAVQHLNAAPPRLEDRRADLPAGLTRIIHKLMAKKPAERYATARDLLHDLRSLHIEGLASDWADGMNDWSTPEIIALADARVEATLHLEALMKTSAMLTPQRRSKKPLVAGLLACLLAGIGFSLLTRASGLLSGTAVSKVPQRESAWEQLYHAKMVDTEPAWRSVWEYFPENAYAVNLARQGLVRHYLWQTGQYEKSLPVLEELIALGDTEVPFRAFGLAGKCVALSLLRQPDEANSQFDQLTSEMIDQLDPQMGRMLDDIMSRNRTALNREASQKLERLKASLSQENLD